MKAAEDAVRRITNFLNQGEVTLATEEIARLRTLDPKGWHKLVGTPASSPLISIRDSVLQDVTLVFNLHDELKSCLDRGTEEEIATAMRKHTEYTQVFNRFKEKLEQARRWMDLTSTERWLHRLMEATEETSDERKYLLNVLAKQTILNQQRREKLVELEAELQLLRSQARSQLERRWSSRYPTEMEMNEKQIEAVGHHEGRLVLTAGPGSGKTHVLVKRMANLIEAGCTPERILMLTFTVKATAEMSERVSRELRESGVGLPCVVNFNSFCKECIESDPLGFGYQQTPVHVAPGLRSFLIEDLIDTDIQEELRTSLQDKRFRDLVLALDDLLHNRAMDTEKTVKEFSKELLEPMEANWSKAEQADIEPSKDLLFARRVMLALQAVGPLRELIRGKGGLTFGDQITLVHQRLMSSDGFLETLASRYDHILVDEFQDNNMAQGQIVQELSDHVTSTCVVGDADQAIYNFRGANVRNLIEFMEAFDDATRIDLNVGYRHSQTLIDISTNLIQRNHGRMNRPDVQSGWVNDDKTDVYAIEYLDMPSEAIECIEWMKGQHLRGYEWSEMAILGRSLNHLASLKSTLQLEGIPFVSTSSETLFLDPSTRYAGLLLRACLDPIQQGHALHMLMMEGAFGILREDATILGAKSRGAENLFTLLEQEASGFRHPDALQACRNFINTHRLVKQDLTDWMFGVIKDAGLTDKILQEGPNHPLTSLLNHLTTQIEIAGRLLKNNVRFARLLEQLMEGGMELEIKDVQRPGHVLLSTIHQSKGLEWHIVLLPSMDKKATPIPDEGSKGKHLVLGTLLGEDSTFELEQERIRVLYVGATRAIDTLHVSYHIIGTGVKVRTPNALFVETASLVGQKHVGIQHPSLVGRGLSGNERTLYDLRSNLEGALKPLTHGNEVEEIRATIRSAVTYHLEQMAQNGRTLTPELHELVHGVEHIAGDLSFRVIEPVVQEDEPMTDTVEFQNFRNYSWSMLDTFSRCPLSFHFKYRLRIVTPSSRAARKGVLVHEVLEMLSQSKEEYSTQFIDQCIGKVLKKYSNELPILPDHEILAATEAIHAWACSPQATYKVTGVEETLRFSFHGRPFVGKIDRIDFDDSGRVRLVDFKTGKPGKKPGATKAEQLLLYAHGWSEVNGQLPDVLVLDHVMHGETKESEVTALSLEKGLSRLIPVIDAIDEGEYDATPGHHCNFCDFRSLCPNSE